MQPTISAQGRPETTFLQVALTPPI